MVDDIASLRKETCRILVVGARRDPLMKVLSLLQSGSIHEQTPSPPYGQNDAITVSKTTVGVPQHFVEHAIKERICIEYVPCVAVFGSYEDEKRNLVRYLVRMDLCEPEDNNSSSSPSGLLQFFDQEQQDEDCNTRLFRGVDGVAIGAGVDGDEDAARIQSYFETMVAGKGPGFMPELRIIRPTAPFQTMKEEIAAYRLLSAEEKEDMMRQQTMGPGKMAKMARGLAMELIEAVLQQKYGASGATEPEQSNAATNSGDEHVEQLAAPHTIDTNEVHFKCCRCRVTLFGQADLENPPHTPSRHSFSHKKLHHGGLAASSCQSLFLQRTLDWMGREGRFSCPNCKTKLGSTTWSGSQCSCGTWVVPAIQIPKSKVDLIDSQAPPSTIPPVTMVHTLSEM